MFSERLVLIDLRVCLLLVRVSLRLNIRVQLQTILRISNHIPSVRVLAPLKRLPAQHPAEATRWSLETAHWYPVALHARDTEGVSVPAADLVTTTSRVRVTSISNILTRDRLFTVAGFLGARVALF